MMSIWTRDLVLEQRGHVMAYGHRRTEVVAGPLRSCTLEHWMTLPRAKSRPIAVDDRPYRYQISTTKLDPNGNYQLNVSIEREEGRGVMLQVCGLVTRDFWLDSSDPGPKDLDDYPSITPRHIAQFIRLGLADGWQPDASGAVHRLTLTNEALSRSDADPQ